MENPVTTVRVKQKELQIEEVKEVLAKIAVKQEEEHSEQLDPVISQLNRFIAISRDKIETLKLEDQERQYAYTY